MKPLFAIALLGVIVGCLKEVKPRTASELMSAWADLGIYVPTEKDVVFIRDRLPDSLEALRVRLAHNDKHVRMEKSSVGRAA
jgi:hypothetical protein